MRSNDLLTRRYMGCGYEPPLEVLHGQPIRPAAWRGERPCTDEDAPTVCVGYTTKLPEVIEASRARMWFDKGQLEVFTGGEQPSEPLVIAVELLERENYAVREAEIARAKREQGAQRR